MVLDSKRPYREGNIKGRQKSTIKQKGLCYTNELFKSFDVYILYK